MRHGPHVLDGRHALGAPGRRRGGRRRIASAIVGALLIALWSASAAEAHRAARALSLRANPLTRFDAEGPAPRVEVESATEVTKNSAVLNAVVNPEGVEVQECYFEWGTAAFPHEHKAQCHDLPGSGTNGVPVYAVLSGLSEDTTYYFRIVAVNEFHSAVSTEKGERFATLPRAPHASSEGAREIEHTSANLFGFVNPNGGEVSECYFEYGTTKVASETQTAECTALPGDGERAVPVSAPVTGLTESTAYFVRLVAVSAYGVGVSGWEEFTTLPNAPHANTESARDVTETSAKLRGFVNPHGEEVTECYFEYGKEKRLYGKTVSCEQAVGDGEERVEVTAEVSGLEKSSEYNFQLVASNGKGRGFGGNARFRTIPNTPKADTNGANELTGDSALLHATVNPEGGEVTTCEFEYSAGAPTLTSKVPCESLPGNGTSPVPVRAHLSGLQPKTRYYCQVRVVNSFGEAHGGVSRFTTLEAGLPPTIRKLSPSKGAEGGGNSVKVLGTNYSNVLEVKFGSNEATRFEVKTTKEIIAVAPPGTPGTVEVTVTTGAGTSAPSSEDEYTYK